MSFKIGSTIGSYEIIEKLGQGGMATVYKGRHTRLKRDVAIKILHPMLNDDDSFLRRFDREAQLVAQLEHPHIVPVYDFAEHSGQPYLVMRLIEGDTLKERMTQGTLSRDEILRIAQSVADGLDYAHGEGVLHRDIKPSNVMLTSANGVYIADFGLARMAQAGESTLSQDMIMGTPQYISPEQAKGNKDLDGRTDLYSFGIILYEMVTGQAPFQSETTYSIIHMQIFDAPPLPSSVNPNISPEMESVLLKALSKEPEARYATGRELVNAFRAAFEAMPEDFAPSGKTVLPDYTPAGVTRAQPETEVVNETVAEPAPEPLAPEMGATTPSSPKQKKPIPAWAFILGTTLVVVLLAALAFGLFEFGEFDDEGDDEWADDPPIAQEVDQPIENPPPSSEQEPDAPDNEANSLPPGRPLILQPPQNIRPISEIEAALEENPNDPQVKVELAVAYMQEGKPDEARAVIGDVFSRFRQPGQFFATTDRLMETENYELASLILYEGLSRFREDPELQHRLLMTLIFANAEPEAIEEYVGFVSETDSLPTEINQDMAEAYLIFVFGNPEEALFVLEELVDEENPFMASTFFLIGRVHQEMDNREAAGRAFDQAFDHEPFPWLVMQIEKQIDPQ